jgi:hypothetical protein
MSKTRSVSSERGSGDGGLVAFEVDRIKAVRPAQDDVDEE